MLEKEGFKTEIIPYNQSLNTPYQKNFDSGIVATSFATWICPLDCDEPTICPHTQAPRTWDFREHFKKVLRPFNPSTPLRAHSAQGPTTTIHTFFCTALVYGVAYIPLKNIAEEWRKLKKSFGRGNLAPTKFIVATHSKCHGIVGMGKIVG